ERTRGRSHSGHGGRTRAGYCAFQENQRLMTDPMKRILATALFFPAAPCLAQSDTTASIPHHVCWRGKPLPKCGSFWVTEAGYELNVSSTHTREAPVGAPAIGSTNTFKDFDSRFIWTIGPMFNAGPRRAIGGTLSLSPFNQGARVAAEARRRWWTQDGNALDLSAGVVRLDV